MPTHRTIHFTRHDSSLFFILFFVNLVVDLLPAGLILIAMVFLRRTLRSSKTLLLQSLAIAWFLTAVIGRLASNPLIGLPMVPGHTRAFAQFANPQEAEAYMASYFNVVMVLGYVEKALFIAVAIVLLGFYRDQLGGRDRYVRSIGGAKTDEYRQV